MRSIIALVPFVASIFAAPTVDSQALAPATSKELSKRSFCGQWDTQTSGPYSVQNDLWGESSGSGWQCTQVNWENNGYIGWQTTWNWSGGQNSVKSFAHVALDYTPMRLYSITSIPTYWSWSYSGSNMVCDVAYDMFLGWNPTGGNSYEIMVWLAEIGGAGPISSTGYTPKASPTIGGIKWNLFIGPNGDTTVYSFVVSSDYDQTYSGDLNSFIQYLEQNEGLSNDLYLQSCTGGTEPFTGTDATFYTESFGVSINT